MTTLSPKPDPFKRSRFQHHHQNQHPIPIRSPAVDVFHATTGSGSTVGKTTDADATTGRVTGGGRGVGGSGRQIGMNELARRSIAAGNGRVQDQNDGPGSAGPTASAGSKGIAGLEAKRSKMGFTGGVATTGINSSSKTIPSPFAMSMNNGARSTLMSGRNGATTGSGSGSRSNISTSRSVTLEPTRHRTPVPDPFPTPDVFYEPPATMTNGVAKSTHAASPFLSARLNNTKSTGSPLFKPPAPPSQSKRTGTPILPHAKTSTSTRSVLNTLPQPGITNLHLNGTANAVAGPSANKRRKTESGAVAAETTSQQHQQQQQLSKQENHADYKNKYTKAFPSFVFCFDAEFLINPNKRGAVGGEKGFSVKECKEGIRRMGGVSLVGGAHVRSGPLTRTFRSRSSTGSKSRTFCPSG